MARNGTMVRERSRSPLASVFDAAGDESFLNAERVEQLAVIRWIGWAAERCGIDPREVDRSSDMPSLRYGLQKSKALAAGRDAARAGGDEPALPAGPAFRVAVERVRAAVAALSPASPVTAPAAPQASIPAKRRAKATDENDRHKAGELPIGDPGRGCVPVGPDGSASPPEGLIIVNGADVVEREVEWLWEPYLPRGALCFLSGRPASGKTWLALWLGAVLSTGRGLMGQDGAPLPERAPERVLFASAEDDIERTLARRFRWLGGDHKRIDFVRGRHGPDGSVLPVTFSDALALELAVREKSATLLVLDPYTAFFGAGGDMNDAGDTRTRLALMRGLAERTGATVLVVRHFKKGASDYALGRGAGSGDATAIARAELHAGEHEGSHALAHAKAALGEKGTSLGYRIVAAPELGRKAARLEWTGAVKASADDLDPPPKREQRGETPRDDAKDTLRELMADGPVLAKDAKEALSEYSAATARRAKDELQVAVKRIGVPGGRKGAGEWWWSLPGQAWPEPTPAQGEQMSILIEPPCGGRGYQESGVSTLIGGEHLGHEHEEDLEEGPP